MRREVLKSGVWGLIVTVLLGAAIVVGSRNLSRFDSALVAYTFATLFAAFGLGNARDGRPTNGLSKRLALLISPLAQVAYVPERLRYS